MDATLVLIDSDAELARARVLVDRLWKSDLPTDIARLQAQARLIAAYEESKWPRRPPSTGNLIRHLMDQHGLTRADMVPILGTPSRVSEVLGGKKGSVAIDIGANIGATALVLAKAVGPTGRRNML
jgi:HTH-type transcriptional regulator/antitoxin HigA